MAKFTGREYFVMDTEAIAKEMGMSLTSTERLLKSAQTNFQIKWKERVGTHATIEDIIPVLRGRGAYVEMSCL